MTRAWPRPFRGAGADALGQRRAADVLDAVKAGATGYLVKSASREEFLEAVSARRGGDAVFTPGLAGLVLGEYRRLAAAPAGADDPTRPG